MAITHLNDLKKNKFFIFLNQMQSQLDNKDQRVLQDQFTRSPLHVIQFLVIYAGLNEIQRQHVIAKLNDPLITKQSLDTLILDIDWVAVLQIPKESTLQFRLSVGLADRVNFFEAVKTKCPSLYQALNNPERIVSINEANQVVLITKVSQTELWKIPFKPGEQYWDVPSFNLSPSLEKIIKNLKENQEQAYGGICIQKGAGKIAKTIKLCIRMPVNSEEFSIKSETEVNSGIYSAFIGLTNVYGLSRVDEVTAKIESEAHFYDAGASASQIQRISLIAQSGHFYLSDEKPTIIYVNSLNVLFQGADIVANFTERTEKTDSFNPELYITLPTKSKNNTHIILLAEAPKPVDAFLLATQFGNRINSELKPASVRRFFSFISPLASPVSKEKYCAQP